SPVVVVVPDGAECSSVFALPASESPPASAVRSLGRRSSPAASRFSRVLRRPENAIFVLLQMRECAWNEAPAIVLKKNCVDTILRYFLHHRNRGIEYLADSSIFWCISSGSSYVDDQVIRNDEVL